MICFAIVVVLGVIRIHSWEDWAWGLLGGAIVFTVPVVLVRVNAILRVTPGRVTYRSMLRLAHTCPRADISRGVRVRVRMAGQYSTGRLLLLDGREQVLLSIQDGIWAAKDLARLWDELQVSLVEADGALSCAELIRRFPGNEPLVLRHPLWVSLGACASVFAIIFIVLVVLAAG